MTDDCVCIEWENDIWINVEYDLEEGFDGGDPSHPDSEESYPDSLDLISIQIVDVPFDLLPHLSEEAIDRIRDKVAAEIAKRYEEDFDDTLPLI
jgi:hypothetical protein